MANVKQAGDTTNLLINGGLAGLGTYGLVAGLRELQRRARMRRNLAKLEETAQRELAKDDISISGNFFKDKYREPAVKQAGFNFKTDMPALATFGAGAGLGWVGGELLHEILKSKKSPQTPQFAVNYKNKRQKEFERAVRLLRAVTDAPTWRDMTANEKTASLKKKAWIVPALAILLGALGVGGGLYVANKTGKQIAESANKGIQQGTKAVEYASKGVSNAAGRLFGGLGDDYTNYVRPAVATGAIALGGYTAYKGLKKLLYNMRKSHKNDLAEDSAVNAWLAQRQELGEPGKVLNTYIDTNDSAERKELNNILKAYESRYKK